LRYQSNNPVANKDLYLKEQEKKCTKLITFDQRTRNIEN